MNTEIRRSKQEIIHDMLHALQEKGGTIKPTHLLYKSNLSHTRMKEYLDELRGKGLIEEQIHKDKMMIALTDQGYEFLAKLRQLKAFTEAFGL